MKESTDNGVDFEMQELLNAEQDRAKENVRIWFTHSPNWFPAGFQNPFIGTYEEYNKMCEPFWGMEDTFKITGCQDYPLNAKLKMNFDNKINEYLYQRTKKAKENRQNEYNYLNGKI